MIYTNTIKDALTPDLHNHGWAAAAKTIQRVATKKQWEPNVKSRQRSSENPELRFNNSED